MESVNMATRKMERPSMFIPFLNIVQTPDGFVKREPEPRNPADANPEGDSPVISKDVTLDPDKNTWLRLYLPRPPKSNNSSSSSVMTKLPLIVYYHGGGFVFCYADSVLYDVFCKGLVEKVGAMVISLDYRLAPDHRLPAAYEDAVDGLRWISSKDDDWVRDYADLSNCYLCGTSAGGNLAYNAGLRAASMSMAKELGPLKIKGMILHHPYFSGSKRTKSEEKLANDSILPLYAIDQMFELCLPKGASPDHEYRNPLMASAGSTSAGQIDAMKSQGWRVLVTGCFDDPLVDACVDFAKFLEDKGLRTVKLFSEGYHAMEVFDPSVSGPLYDTIRDFLQVL